MVWPNAVSADGNRIAARTDWRAFFPDLRLQALIEAALEHNRDMHIAAARVEEARAQYGIARADRLPTVNLGGSYNIALTPGNLGGSNQSVTGQSHNVSLTSISYEVDFWSRISGLSESARASYLASEETRRAMRLSLVSDVANAYFSLLELEERGGLARENMAAREKARDIVGLGRNSGFASTLDYLQVDSALESARSELATIERERAAAANLLQLLVGRMPERLPSGNSLMAQGVEADLAAGLPSEVLVARPDVLAAEQRLIAAHASIGAARAAFLPKILLTAAFGTASRALVDLFAGGSQSWNFQPAISMPLFDGGRITSNIELAEARKVTAVAEYEKTLQQAFREVADLLAARATLADNLRAVEANVKNQEERFRIAQILFKGGRTGYIDVLDAQRELLAARQMALQVRRMRLTVAAQLYKALGGGS